MSYRDAQGRVDARLVEGRWQLVITGIPHDVMNEVQDAGRLHGFAITGSSHSDAGRSFTLGPQQHPEPDRLAAMQKAMNDAMLRERAAREERDRYRRAVLALLDVKDD